MLRKKKIQAGIVVIVAMIIVLVGAFAWNSFTQSEINEFRVLTAPGANLHDDFFEGPNKDVYVENSGTLPIYVRIHLTEFLWTQDRESLVEGHIDAQGDNKYQIARAWAPHNAIVTSGSAQEDVHSCALEDAMRLNYSWPANDNFHKYFEWIFGGESGANEWIYFKPATEEQKGGDDRNPSVVDDPLTETSERGDAHLEYMKLMADKGVTPSAPGSESQAELDSMEELGIKKTLVSLAPVTMKDWLALSAEQQTAPRWVIDEDGWCYWSQPLASNTATGLLLDKVNWTEQTFDSDATYKINVWLNAVDIKDIALLETNGGITNNGKRLMNTISGQSVTLGDKTFNKKLDGTYFELDGDGNETGAAVIPIGTANATSFTNADAANVLKVGDTFGFSTPVTWNGTAYDNYGGAGSEPKYNLGGGSDYTIKGVVTGKDGKQYLEVTDGDGVTHYVTSIGAAPDYPIVPLGTGPFAIVYVDSVNELGTKNMQRANTAVKVDNRDFYHLGNGVYIEVAEAGATTQIEDTTDAGKYYFYFAGDVLSTTTVGAATIAETFPLKLAVGETFSVTFDGGNSGKTNAFIGGTGDTAIKFGGLEKGSNGNQYIMLDDDDGGYISVDTVKYLGLANNIRVWAGPMGIGSGDIITPPDISGEGTEAKPFLVRGKAEMVYISEKLAAGETFEGKHFKVTANIDLKDATEPSNKVFKPIGSTAAKSFKGTFDGDGKNITGLTLTSGASNQGLFAYLGAGGVVENVKLVNVSITGGGLVGGIAATNAGQIENCVVSGSITSNSGGSNRISGIVGDNLATGIVIGCTNNALISSDTTGGMISGIVGANQSGGKVENCSNTGNVTASAKDNVGGVVGNNTGTVTNSSNTGAVSGKDYAGGVAGNNTGTVSTSYNTGAVSGGGYVGGVAGRNNAGTVSASHNTGAVSGSGGSVAGVVGANVGATSKVENCYSMTGTVTGTSAGSNNVGGVVGNNAGTVSASYNASAVSGASYTGGVAGNNTGTVYTSFNTGAVSGNSYTGGVVGNNSTNAEVVNCYAEGNVTATTGTSMDIGGVVGRNDGGKVSYTYYKGGTIQGNYVGGVVGRLASATGSLTNSVAWNCTVAFTEGAQVRYNKILGFLMTGTATYSDCWTSNVTLTPNASGSLGWEGTGEAPNVGGAWWQAVLGFDFTNTWEWKNGQPALKGVTP